MTEDEMWEAKLKLLQGLETIIRNAVTEAYQAMAEGRSPANPYAGLIERWKEGCATFGELPQYQDSARE